MQSSESGMPISQSFESANHSKSSGSMDRTDEPHVEMDMERRRRFINYNNAKLEQGSDGKWAVCFSNLLNLNESDIRIAFLEFGEVYSVRTSGKWVFVRFQRKDEAQLAVESVTLREVVGGYVKPAINTQKESKETEGGTPQFRSSYKLFSQDRPPVLHQPPGDAFSVGIDFSKPPPVLMQRKEEHHFLNTSGEQVNNALGQGHKMYNRSRQEPTSFENRGNDYEHKPGASFNNAVLNRQGYGVKKHSDRQSSQFFDRPNYWPHGQKAHTNNQQRDNDSNTSYQEIDNLNTQFGLIDVTKPFRQNSNNSNESTLYDDGPYVSTPTAFTEMYGPRQQHGLKNKRTMQNQQQNKSAHEAKQSLKIQHEEPYQRQTQNEIAAKMEKRAALKIEKKKLWGAKRTDQKKYTKNGKGDTPARRNEVIYHDIIISNFPDDLDVDDLWVLFDEKDIVDITIHTEKNFRYCHVYVSSAQKEAELLAIDNSLVLDCPLLVQRVEDLMFIGLAKVSSERKY